MVAGLHTEPDDVNQTERERQVRLLTQHLHEYMSRYGYQVTEVPVIEAADLFLIKAGDQVVNRLFTFERHGQQLALRPEFTAAAAHRYLQNNGESVVRWQFSGAIFEDDPGDTGRHYQRHSIGAELIGMAGASADAEIIGMAAQGLAGQGIQSWHVAIGHIWLLRLVLTEFGLDSRTERFLLHAVPALRDPTRGKSYVLDQLDKLLLGMPDKSQTWTPDALAEPNARHLLDVLLDTTGRGATMGGRTRHDIARRLLQKRQRAAERGQIVAALDALERWCAVSLPPQDAFTTMHDMSDAPAIRQTLADWQQMVDLLDAYDIAPEQIQIQPGLVRSWEYYTGMVFDLMAGDTSLGGGGRYDELARLIGGQHDVPAVGFTYYVDRVIAALPMLQDSHPAALAIALTPENAAAAARWANQLRGQGLTVYLLPLETLPSPLPLTIDDRGYASFNSNVYTLADSDVLVYDLKRVEA
ncbi:MAG: ATP phosphoribosyltransferase regulatory subunit [Chloroflexi bacterium]|nr:ATP phosphoribosyltransferase regulatory subunit [Chloroflexota bacterium]